MLKGGEQGTGQCPALYGAKAVRPLAHLGAVQELGLENRSPAGVPARERRQRPHQSWSPRTLGSLSQRAAPSMLTPGETPEAARLRPGELQAPGCQSPWLLPRSRLSLPGSDAVQAPTVSLGPFRVLANLPLPGSTPRGPMVFYRNLETGSALTCRVLKVRRVALGQ